MLLASAEIFLQKLLDVDRVQRRFGDEIINFFIGNSKCDLLEWWMLDEHCFQTVASLERYIFPVEETFGAIESSVCIDGNLLDDDRRCLADE